MKNIRAKSGVLLFTLLALLSSSVYADRDDNERHHHRYVRDDRGDRHDRHRRDDRRDRKDYRFDSRYKLNRNFPREGYQVRTLPERRYPIHYRNQNYFYFGGVWYRPHSSGYVVVRPPIGIRVAILPPYYSTVWFGGIPYYYANDVYYVWRPDLNTYEVTNPPAAATTNAPEPPVMGEELYIYPKKNQSEQQQADDRYACHRWGVKETGYDPTQSPTDMSQSEVSQKREEYQRAMKACLEGRGYSVR